MAFCAFVWFPFPESDGEMGICLLSPEAWGLPPLLSWGINVALMFLMSVTLAMANRRYNFIPTPSNLFSGAWLIMAGTNIVVASHLCTSTLLGLANLLCIITLISQYGQSSFTRGIFFIASTLAWGSMFQYSFLFFIPVYAVCAAVLKLFHWKEFMAMLMGVATPYIILLGLGAVSPEQFYMPRISYLWDAFKGEPESVVLIVMAGVTALWTLLLALRNFIPLMTASTAVRAYNVCVTLPGLAMLILMMVDYGNFMAYYLSLAMIGAIQLGYLTAFGSRRVSPLPYLIHLALYLSFFILSLYYGLD